MTQSDANSIAFTFILPEDAANATDTGTGKKADHHNATSSRQLRVRDVQW